MIRKSLLSVTALLALSLGGCSFYRVAGMAPVQDKLYMSVVKYAGRDFESYMAKCDVGADKSLQCKRVDVGVK